MIENQQKHNQMEAGTFVTKPPARKKVKMEDMNQDMQYVEKQQPLKKFELDTSYVDSTLELVDTKTRDIDLNQLISNDNVIPSNKLGQDQFCALYREMLSLRKEIQILSAPKPLHVHGKKPPIRRTDMDFKLDILDERTEQPSFEELILNNIEAPSQITGEGLRHDQFRVLYREMLAMRKEMRAVVTAQQAMLTDTASVNAASANLQTPYVPPIPDTKSTAWQRQFNPNSNSTVDCRPATLCENPKTLYVLWQEYMYGIHGRKPAREFTKQDKVSVRARYSQRRVIWDQINKLMRSKYRFTANEAIEKIYSVYGIRTPVTVIIKKIREDMAKSEGNPDVSVIEQFLTAEPTEK
jgi:Transcriptional activator of glycolytic enzymes